ncbi:MAG: hypothetical protein KF729_33255 [Sandaracinaceae bacterium]|nr:hypothetical protein [Sandaracinaceae bacterium]
MHHPLRTSLASFAAGTILFVAAVPSAQVPGPSPTLNGTWRLDGSVEDARTTVQAAVNPAVAPLTPDVQRMARARIRESTGIPSQIVIQASPERMRLEISGEDAHVFEGAPGESQNVYSRSGVRAQLTQTYRPDGGIEQRFRTLDGTQWNFYTPQPDGQRLYLDVLMRSQRLARDIRFRLSFSRAG